MISTGILDPGSCAAWDDYVLSRPGTHFAQRTAWRKLTSRFFRVEPLWWWAKDAAGRIAGVLPAFRHGRTMFTPSGGLAADSVDAAQALLGRAREDVAAHGLTWLELRDQAVEWPELPTSHEHVTLSLPIATDPDAMWASFDAKQRNQIRKAQKSGLVTRTGHAHLDAFHRVFSENMRDLGTPAMEAAYFRHVLELYGEAAEVLVVYRGEEPIGGMIVVLHGRTLFDPWASSLRKWLGLCPNNLLYWEALQLAARRGATAFDFGRSQPGTGTFRFKQSFGAEPRPLFYQYVAAGAMKVPSLADQKSTFELASRIWRKLPLSVARTLGPRARRHFPEAL